eukprot:TRINITY_DN26011_c0_g1_i1.p1 TRINITY_DN26011_c0_g1~~TRINITY_DN26011_c0_g1_i1.p1  ORF type:complete len:733 (+),score=130.53 TRINITY_DN26011_c0_g1_i1:72-2270(+)
MAAVMLRSQTPSAAAAPQRRSLPEVEAEMQSCTQSLQQLRRQLDAAISAAAPPAKGQHASLQARVSPRLTETAGQQSLAARALALADADQIRHAPGQIRTTSLQQSRCIAPGSCAPPTDRAGVKAEDATCQSARGSWKPVVAGPPRLGLQAQDSERNRAPLLEPRSTTPKRALVDVRNLPAARSNQENLSPPRQGQQHGSAGAPAQTKLLQPDRPRSLERADLIQAPAAVASAAPVCAPADIPVECKRPERLPFRMMQPPGGVPFQAQQQQQQQQQQVMPMQPLTARLPSSSFSSLQGRSTTPTVQSARRERSPQVASLPSRAVTPTRWLPPRGESPMNLRRELSVEQRPTVVGSAAVRSWQPPLTALRRPTSEVLLPASAPQRVHSHIGGGGGSGGRQRSPTSPRPPELLCQAGGSAHWHPPFRSISPVRSRNASPRPEPGSVAAQSPQLSARGLVSTSMTSSSYVPQVATSSLPVPGPEPGTPAADPNFLRKALWREQSRQRDGSAAAASTAPTSAAAATPSRGASRRDEAETTLPLASPPPPSLPPPPWCPAVGAAPVSPLSHGPSRSRAVDAVDLFARGAVPGGSLELPGPACASPSMRVTRGARGALPGGSLELPGPACASPSMRLTRGAAAAHPSAVYPQSPTHSYPSYRADVPATGSVYVMPLPPPPPPPSVSMQASEDSFVPRPRGNRYQGQKSCVPYPDSFDGTDPDPTWLRAPFGAQHQVAP